MDKHTNDTEKLRPYTSGMSQPAFGGMIVGDTMDKKIQQSPGWMDSNNFVTPIKIYNMISRYYHQ